MLKTLLLAAGFVGASLAPASAAFVDQQSQRRGDWLFRLQQDAAAPGQPRRCLASTVVPAGQLSMIVSFLEVIEADGSATMRRSLHLYNTAWQLGPNSSGTAAVQVGDAARSYAFRRISDTELSATLADDTPTFDWLQSLLNGSATVTVRLPNGASSSIPRGSPEILHDTLLCTGTLHQSRPAPNRDPFAPSPVQRDPFAPTR